MFSVTIFTFWWQWFFNMSLVVWDLIAKLSPSFSYSWAEFVFNLDLPYPPTHIVTLYLFLGDCLPSSLWLDLCKSLNQSDKFGSVDQESPTGIEASQNSAPLESTVSATAERQSLGLQLDVSSILHMKSQG